MCLLNNKIKSYLDENIFPANIVLNGMYIECNEMLNETSLTSNANLQINNNTIDLVTVLEDYKVFQQFAVNRTQLKSFNELTQVTKIFELNLRNKNFVNELKPESIDLIVQKDGELTMFLYWYDYEAILSENNKLRFNSFCSFMNCNFNLAGVMEYNKLKIEKKQKSIIKTQVLLKHDIFFIKIENFY